MSHITRKPVFRVSDQVRHKSSCTATDYGKTLGISDLGGLYYLWSENKSTDQLHGKICAFLPVHKTGLCCWLSHKTDFLMMRLISLLNFFFHLLGRKYKSQRFKDWLFGGLNLDMKPSIHCLEILSYLAYETIAQVR